MESLTKRKLSDREIEALVRKAFGEHIGVTEIKEIEEGWFNAVYSMALSDGREIVLKMAPSKDIRVLRYEKDLMKAEVEVMRLIYEKRNIPVPKVLYYDNSGETIENPYFFMEKIKGQPYSKVKGTLSQEKREAVEKELGIYNRYINDIKGETFGLYAQEDKRCGKWTEAFLGMVRDVLQDGKDYDVKLPREYEEIEQLYLKNSYALDLVTEPSLVHWDLHDGNIFINDEGKIIGIIDFERVLWGDPLLEVYFGNFFDNKNFCIGYGENLLNTEEGKIRRTMYNVYLCLIMVIECKYRNFQNEGHLQWAYTKLEKELNSL